MPTQDKEKTPNCPKCGQFMDKVEVVVMENIQGGTMPISHDQNDRKIAWACVNAKCQETEPKS